MRSALPLGDGILLDPFMGSGATVAAAVACGLTAVGVESNDDYFLMARRAIPALAKLDPGPLSNGNGNKETS